MTLGTTRSRYDKARQKEKAIHLIENKGIDVEEAFSKLGLRISRYSYPRILARYKTQGIEGLIDPRGGKRFEKLTDDMKEQIRSIKEERRAYTAAQICEMVKKRFSIDVHQSHMSRVLSSMGLNGPVGRPPKRETHEEIPFDHAGSYFLKAALLAMDLPRAITGIIVRTIKDIKKCAPKYQVGNLEILSANPDVIRPKIETLLFMPVFRIERMWHLETATPQKGLGLVVSSRAPHKYRTMDNFLREVSKLDIVEPLNKILAKRYAKAFRVRFHNRKSRTLYIDSHQKRVWTKKHVAKDRQESRHRISRYQDVYVIHDSKGRPLLSTTRPGGSYMGEGIFPLIEALKQSLERQVADLAIFECDKLSVGLCEAFARRRMYFLTGLRKNKHYSVNDFEMTGKSSWEAYQQNLNTGEVNEEVLDCDKTLVDSSNNKRKFRVRAILQREVGSKAFSVIVTNIGRKEEPDAKKIADTYRTHRDQRETAFRQIKPSLYLDTDAPYPPGLTVHEPGPPRPKRSLAVEDQTKGPWGIGSPKDHILTILEMALNNAHIFVKENYFPEQYRGFDFTTTRDVLYKQEGRLVETKEATRITLDHYGQESDHQMLAEHAAQRVNDAKLVTEKGKRLIIEVSRD